MKLKKLKPKLSLKLTLSLFLPDQTQSGIGFSLFMFLFLEFKTGYCLVIRVLFSQLFRPFSDIISQLRTDSRNTKKKVFINMGILKNVLGEKKRKTELLWINLCMNPKWCQEIPYVRFCYSYSAEAPR